MRFVDAMQVFEWQMCSRSDVDSHRFMDAIQEAIEAGTVKRYDLPVKA